MPRSTEYRKLHWRKGRHLIQPVKDHSGKNLKSHLFKHSVKTIHKMVALDDFKVVGKSWRKSKFRRGLAESLHIKVFFFKYSRGFCST